MDISSNNKDLTDYDVEMVSEFENGILFKEGKYFMRLPWKKEK